MYHGAEKTSINVWKIINYKSHGSQWENDQQIEGVEPSFYLLQVFKRSLWKGLGRAQQQGGDWRDGWGTLQRPEIRSVSPPAPGRQTKSLCLSVVIGDGASTLAEFLANLHQRTVNDDFTAAGTLQRKLLYQQKTLPDGRQSLHSVRLVRLRQDQGQRKLSYETSSELEAEGSWEHKQEDWREGYA